MKTEKRIKITQYKWAGGKWFFKINSPCSECDLTTSILKELAEHEFNGQIDLEIKPWLDNAFKLLFRGMWHAPIVIINGKIFSQGKVPEKSSLRKEIIKNLEQRDS